MRIVEKESGEDTEKRDKTRSKKVDNEIYKRKEGKSRGDKKRKSRRKEVEKQ